MREARGHVDLEYTRPAAATTTTAMRAMMMRKVRATMAVSVKVITDGPLMVKGECEMQDGQGNAMPPKGGDTIFLCRCGSSANKPYCDGAHKRISFKG